MKTIKSKDVHEVSWHTFSADGSLNYLKSSINGLNQEEIKSRLEKYGENRLPEQSRKSSLTRFFLQFHNILIYVLLVCVIITATLDHWVDSGVILAVVIVNAIIGFIQEGKAEKAIEAIRDMLAPNANVIRGGKRMSIKGEHLVPGDIVLLEAGDKVPADLRLLISHGLHVQESILTGESVPVEKNTYPVASDTVLGDRSCMSFSGTLVTNGQGKGVVVATGKQTEIGRISGLLSEVEKLTTPLVQQMNIFAKWLTILILLLAVILIIYGYFVSHHDFLEMFMAVVGLSIAAIPEGLPAILTITLSVGVKAMAKRNAIVRHLPAIETLGAVSVICTDKTGTLTRNEMMVASIITCKHLFTIEGDGYTPKGSLKIEETNVSPSEHKVLEELARAAVLCNDATLHEKEGGIWHIEGDPMEGALLSFAYKIDLKVQEEQALWKRTDVIPFDSIHRFMATLNHDHRHRAFIFVKGAPERILAMCEQQRSFDGKTEPLNNSYWNEKAETIASFGQRVLAFALKSVNPQHTVLEYKDIEGKLTLLGIVGMIDPPRSEAIEAITQCQKTGIRVKMITGDHAKTASAIGKQIGLQNYQTVLTGVDLEQMGATSLSQAVLDCDIFARTNPNHKLKLVMALQSYGLIVAMTGDGVNDSPALKRADIGIAMGKKGSEAAKEAAQLVLADDNFASIVAAIREGRTVYDNIKKVISWTLPTNAGEAAAIIVALLFGLIFPITPIQILWINLITSVTLGISLAFEPTSENTMHRPPKTRYEPIINGELIWHIIFISLLFVLGIYGVYSYAIDRGYTIELARTITVNTVVIMETFHMFFIRNIHNSKLTWKLIRGTKIMWLVVMIVVFAQLAITYIPPLQKLFSTTSIPFWDVLLIIAIGLILFIIIEIEKRIRFSFRDISH